MNTTILAALARHTLTALGGAFAVKYGIDGGTMDAIVGGGSALVGVALSLYDKRGRA